MTQPVQVGDRLIGSGHATFTVAEAGVNHNASIELALRLVDAAHAAGADAVKFQIYSAVEHVSKGTPTLGYQQTRTGSSNMLEMARAYDLPWEAQHASAMRSTCSTTGVS
jgi:sialic acid synthase SpsE